MPIKIPSLAHQCQCLLVVSAVMVAVAPAAVAAPCPALGDYAAGILSCDLPQDCSVDALPALNGHLIVFDDNKDGKELIYAGKEGAETLFATVTCVSGRGAEFTAGGLLPVDTTKSYHANDGVEKKIEDGEDAGEPSPTCIQVSPVSCIPIGYYCQSHPNHPSCP